MFVIVDTETTGGNPVNDRIMEIAIIRYDGEKEVERFSTLVNPQNSIAPFIQSLTGITDDMVADAPTFEEIADKVLELTDNSIFVAHNARFDYAVVRREFKRIGIRFQRRQLCTVTLSERLLPDHKSYSLGKICRDLDIEISNRHRALGDAEATVKLFRRLLENNQEEILKSTFEEALERASLPPNLSKETVDDLPEETGVYYFLDENLRVLHVGKGKNIRSRVINQLLKDLKQRRYQKLWDEVYDVSFEITGSELVAQLMEWDEIKQHTPPYNFTKRKKKYRFGIFHFQDQEGYINLEVDKLNPENRALVVSKSKVGATNILRKIVATYGLEPGLCGFGEKQEIELEPESYNTKVGKFLNKYLYKHPNFFIIGEGRSHHEQSVVWVENHQYKGFGFFEPENIENDIESLKDSVKPHANSPEVHRLIRNWLRKKTRDEIIKY